MKEDISIYQVKCPKDPQSSPFCCFYLAKRIRKTPLYPVTYQQVQGSCFLGLQLYYLLFLFLIMYLGCLVA